MIIEGLVVLTIYFFTYLFRFDDVKAVLDPGKQPVSLRVAGW